MTDRITLRDPLETDIPLFFEQQLDPVASQMAAFPPREQPEFSAHWARILADAGVIKKTILFDGQVAGNVVSFEQDGQRYVGYWLGRPFWGQGIATRALALFLGFERRRPLYARVAQHNAGSLRVLQKCGFAIVGEDWIAAAGDAGPIAEFILELPPAGGGSPG